MSLERYFHLLTQVSGVQEVTSSETGRLAKTTRNCDLEKAIYRLFIRKLFTAGDPGPEKQ